MSRMADLDADAVGALTLLRSVAAAGRHAWHPALIGAAVRLLMDWLTDTGQLEARDELHGIDVASPATMADQVRLGDIGEAERRAERAIPLEAETRPDPDRNPTEPGSLAWRVRETTQLLTALAEALAVDAVRRANYDHYLDPDGIYAHDGPAPLDQLSHGDFGRFRTALQVAIDMVDYPPADVGNDQ